MIEDRRKALQSYLQELALIPIVKESHKFKQFLSIDQNFPELKDALVSLDTNAHQANKTFGTSMMVEGGFKSGALLEEIIEEGLQA